MMNIDIENDVEEIIERFLNQGRFDYQLERFLYTNLESVLSSINREEGEYSPLIGNFIKALNEYIFKNSPNKLESLPEESLQIILKEQQKEIKKLEKKILGEGSDTNKDSPSTLSEEDIESMVSQTCDKLSSSLMDIQKSILFEMESKFKEKWKELEKKFEDKKNELIEISNSEDDWFREQLEDIK